MSLNVIFENALQVAKHFTREELVTELAKDDIATDNNRASHILFYAELEGLICSGKTKNNKLTYALLRDRVPKTKTFNREEALFLLAIKYFTSHCPATLQDFAWWSGLSLTESKIGLEMAKSKLVSETIDNKTYWFTDTYSIPKPENDSVYLLPAYDEFIISYRDRTASLPFDINKKAISNNGIFRPAIVINGLVAGIWKRTIKKEKIILETEFFHPINKAINDLLEEAIILFENFMNKKVRKVNHSRLDMRFSKILMLGKIKDYKNFTREIVKTIDDSEIVKNKWVWSENKPVDEPQKFMLKAIQNWVVQLYNINVATSRDNMKRISETVLKYYPDNVESLSNLSVVYLLKYDYDKALEVLLKVEKFAPKDHIVLSNIAQAYKLKGDNQNAIKYYELTIQYGDDKTKEFAKEQIQKLNTK